MSRNAIDGERTPMLRTILVALVFGGTALIIVLADLTVPVPGTKAVTDPRELFTTLGDALSGPLGGVLIGILAGMAVPGFPLASILAHVTGGVWMAVAYKKIVYDRLQTPKGLLVWAGIVMVYYHIFLMPGFIVGLALFYGERSPLLSMYIDMLKGVFPEALLTTFITTVALSALPAKYRRPLW